MTVTGRTTGCSPSVECTPIARTSDGTTRLATLLLVCDSAPLAVKVGKHGVLDLIEIVRNDGAPPPVLRADVYA